MDRQKWICRYCQQEKEQIIDSAGDLRLEPHREVEVNHLGFHFACQGMVELLVDAVVGEQIQAARETLAEIDTKTRPAGKIPTESLKMAKDDTIQARFEEFHTKNPEVLTLLADRTRKLALEGRQRISMSELWEWLRYSSPLTNKFVDASTKFAISNDYRSRYTRRLMEEYPELSHLFEIRGLTAK